VSEFEAVKAAMGKITAKHREEVRMLKDQSLDQQKKLQREVLRTSPLAQPPRHPPPMPPLLFSVSPSSFFESPLHHRTPLDNKIFPSPWCSLDFLAAPPPGSPPPVPPVEYPWCHYAAPLGTAPQTKI